MKKELSDLGGFLAGVLPEQHQPEAERLVNKLREAVELYVRGLGGKNNGGIESSEGGSSQASQAGRLQGVQSPVSIGSVLTVQAERKDWDLTSKLAEASAGVRGDLSRDDGGVAQGAAPGSMKRYTKQWVWLKGESMPWRAEAVTLDQFGRLQRVAWNYPHMDDWDRASRPSGYQGFRIMPNLFLCRGGDVMWGSVKDARRAMEDKGWNDLPGLLSRLADGRKLDESINDTIEKAAYNVLTNSGMPVATANLPRGVRGYLQVSGILSDPTYCEVEFKNGHLVSFRDINGGVPWNLSEDKLRYSDGLSYERPNSGYKFEEGYTSCGEQVRRDRFYKMPWQGLTRSSMGYDPGDVVVQMGWILINDGSSGSYVRTGLVCYRKADKSLVYINQEGVRWYKSPNGQWLTQIPGSDGPDGSYDGPSRKYMGYKFWPGHSGASIGVAKKRVAGMPWEDGPSMVRQHGWITLEGSIWSETPHKAIVEFSKEGHLVKFHFLAHSMSFWWVLQQGKKGPELAFIDLVSGKYDNIPLPFIGYRFLEGRADTHPDDVKILMHGMDVKEAPEWKEEE